MAGRLQALVPGRSRSDRLTRAGLVLWTGAFAACTVVFGIPYTTDKVCLWLCLALLAASLGDLWRAGPRILRDWSGLLGVLVSYNYLRGYSKRTLWAPHYRLQVDADRLLGGGQTVTRRLQTWLFDSSNPHVLDYLVVLVYLSHFVVAFVIMAVLWKRDHARFARFMGSYLLLTFAGFVTFVLVPAEPPWMASAFGYTEPVARLVPEVLERMHLHLAASFFLSGSAYDNEVAAFPSLHAAYPLLICLFFWRDAGRALRVLLAAYPLAMAFTLLYGAEHFVIDIIFGWAYAVVAWAVVRSAGDWWETRHLLAAPAALSVLPSQQPPQARAGEVGPTVTRDGSLGLSNDLSDGEGQAAAMAASRIDRSGWSRPGPAPDSRRAANSTPPGRRL